VLEGTGFNQLEKEYPMTLVRSKRS
jgi:hypothetical protein